MTQTSLPITDQKVSSTAHLCSVDNTYHGLHSYHGSKRDGSCTENTRLI